MPPAGIPDQYHDLFTGSALASLATLRADGTPQVTPVWIDLEEGLILVNARADRLKTANMQRRGDVGVLVVDPANPHRYVSVTGVVDSAAEAGSMPHMDRLAQRYLRVRKYPWAAAGERRLIFRIRPTRVLAAPGDDELPEPEL